MRQNNHIQKCKVDWFRGYIYRYTPRRYAPAYYPVWSAKNEVKLFFAVLCNILCGRYLFTYAFVVHVFVSLLSRGDTPPLLVCILNQFCAIHLHSETWNWNRFHFWLNRLHSECMFNWPRLFDILLQVLNLSYNICCWLVFYRCCCVLLRQHVLWMHKTLLAFEVRTCRIFGQKWRRRIK